MKNVLKKSTIGRIAILLSLPLSACDWVDSAGSDNTGVTPAPEPVAVLEVIQNDEPQNDRPIENLVTLDEQASARLTASVANSNAEELIFTWTSEPVEQGRLDSCADESRFNNELAAASLNEACADPAQCSLEFSRGDTQSDRAEFDLVVPTLKASVGLRYQLEIEDEAGSVAVSDYNFCLISINESPVARADTFVVTDGETLRVTADGINLLTNDSDDLDVSNSALRVVPEESTEPAAFSFFELGVDGSFTYQSSFSGLREDQIDGFEYQLSDGVNPSSTGEVTIRIVAINQAPVQIAEIPAISAMENEPIEVDLAQYFTEPEGSTISFSVSANTVFPPSGEVVLSPEGVLSGTPLTEDVGSYVITVIASDGSLETEAVLSLDIEPAPIVVVNSAPVFMPGSVFDQNTIAGLLITPIRPIFNDPDGDILRYTMAGTRTLPVGVTLNPRTGIISGTPLVPVQANNLRVRATDPSGAFAQSTLFYIRVR